MQLHGVLEECSTLSATLAPGKHYETLGSKEVRLPVIQIIHILSGSINEDPEQGGTLYQRTDAATLHTVALPVPAVVPEETIQVKYDQDYKK